MAGNFRVYVHMNSESLHLRVEGDFDGSSAHQLLCALEEKGNKVKRVFIHTSGLKEILPFGKAVFQENLNHVVRHETDLVFTGDKGPEIALGGHRLLP